MSTTEEQLKRIHDKLQQLLKQHTALKKEKKLLEAELEKARLLTDQQTRNMEVVKQQVDVLKINSGTMNDADKKVFEKRINTYLKEIDRCIAMLGE